MGVCQSKKDLQDYKVINNQTQIQSSGQQCVKGLDVGIQPNLSPLSTQYLEHQKFVPAGQQFDVIHKESYKKFTVGLVEKSCSPGKDGVFLKEFMKLATVVHPNIQRWYDIFETTSSYQVIKECVKGLTFSEYLQKSKPSQIKIKEIFHNIMTAVNQLHSKGIAHNDIQNETIIFENSGQESNFKIITIQELKRAQSNFFQSPETLKNFQTQKSDVWSIGVLLHFALIGELPFDGKDQEQIRNSIQKGIINHTQAFDALAQDAINLLKKMLRYNPIKRPSLQQCLKDSWFSQKPKKLSKEQIQIMSDTQERISSFNCRLKIQQATMLMIIESSQEDKQTNQMLNIFKKLDSDHSGTLSRQELLDGFTQLLGLEQAQTVVEQLFKDYDIDGSGFVDYNEFVLSLCMKSRHLKKTKILSVFNEIDQDKNGSLSKSEIRRLLIRMKMSEQEIVEAIKEFDKDNDGEISKEEFVEAMLMINNKSSESPTKVSKTGSNTPKQRRIQK